MFETNADKVKKGNDETKKSTDDLEESLGRTDRQAHVMGEHIVGTLKEVAGAFAAAFAVDKIFEGIKAQAELNAQLGETATRLGVNIEDLAAWGEGSKRNGGSVEEFAGTLDFLNKNLAAVDATGTSRVLPFFKKLKIQGTDAHGKIRPLFDLLGDLAGRFEHMSKQESAGYAEKLGIGPGTLLLLQSGRKGVEDTIKRMKELGVTTKEDAETAHAFNDQLDDLHQVLGHIYTAIGSAVLPSLMEFFHWIEKIATYLSSHATLVEGFFIGVAGVISYLYLPAMIEAAVATFAALAPFLLIGAAIIAVGAAFALIYDDVMNFLKGNQSVIGELSKRWPWVGETIKTVVQGIADIFEWAVGVIKGAIDLWVAAFELAYAVMALVGRVIIGEWRAVVTFIEEKIKALVKAFPLLGVAFRAVGEVFKAVGHAILEVFEWIISKVAKLADFYKWITGGLKSATVTVNGVAVGQSALATAGGAHLGALSSTSLTSLRGGDKNVKVDVGGIKIDAPGADAQTVGDKVGDSLADHMRQAVNHFDDGVRN